MSTPGDLTQLILRWQELREQLQTVSAEELCKDRPELLPEVRRRIEALRKMEETLSSSAGSDGEGGSPAFGKSLGDVETIGWEGSSEGNVERSSPGSGAQRYQIVRELGRGGMGVVYEAIQPDLKRTVALKMILAGGYASESDLQRFRIEAEAVARLKHPNIVQIYEIGEQNGLPFFSLEFCNGGALVDKMEGAPWEAQEAAKLIETLARGIHTAHQSGIVHRDLKPQNVLLDADGTPKITDFGLAKKMDSQEGVTKTESVMGTPSYMAPEQAKGKTKEVGPAADIYSLGAMLYELLTGRPPFRAPNVLETMRQVAEDEPVSPRQLIPRLSRDLETICLKCLQKDPGRRYSSAEALAEDLQRYLNYEPIRARALGLHSKVWRWCKRYPTRASLLGASLIAFVVFLGTGFWVNERLRQELDRTEQARRAATAAQKELQTALARQIAERIDRDLRQLASVPRTIASLLNRRSDWTEEQLAGCLEEILQREQRIFGICAAFEPQQFQKRDQFALYVHHSGKEIQVKQLLPPHYQPHYREWEWYRLPLRLQRPHWSEPYLDKGGGNIPMITYSVPVWRKGDVVGVVTADLSIDYFKKLRDYLQELTRGKRATAFVISQQGTFVSHPDPRFQMPRKLEDAGIKALLQQGSGSGEGVDFATGKPSRFLFAPVEASGWTFVTVIPSQSGKR